MVGICLSYDNDNNISSNFINDINDSNDKNDSNENNDDIMITFQRYPTYATTSEVYNFPKFFSSSVYVEIVCSQIKGIYKYSALNNWIEYKNVAEYVVSIPGIFFRGYPVKELFCSRI